MHYTLGRPSWLSAVVEEQFAIRKTVGILDQTSFGKLLVRGRDALALLERVCANRIGELTYTAMLNSKGGFESDVTVQRLGEEEFFIVTGSAQPVRDAAWLRRHVAEGEQVRIEDVSERWSVISLLGPKAGTLFSKLELPNGARAVPASYAGGPGWELYVPIEHAAALYDRVWSVGGGLGLKDCGYYALDALRIEAGRRAFGAELSADCTPYEAGLEFAVRRDRREAPTPERTKRLLMFTFPATELFAWGGEPILRDGKAAGELTSVGYSAMLGCMVGMGFVHSARPESSQQVLAGRYEIEVSGSVVAAKAALKAPGRFAD
jgi:4-methylaminobutanoate oxidase (formaldehyde-forming)